jgi:hypothetical protein
MRKLTRGHVLDETGEEGLFLEVGVDGARKLTIPLPPAGPVCAMVWEGKDAVKTGRVMLGFRDEPEPWQMLRPTSMA